MKQIKYATLFLLLMALYSCSSSSVFDVTQDSLDPTLAYAQLPLSFPTTYKLIPPNKNINIRTNLSSNTGESILNGADSKKEQTNTANSTLSAADSEFASKFPTSPDDAIAVSKIDEETLLVVKDTSSNNLKNPAEIYQTLNKK